MSKTYTILDAIVIMTPVWIDIVQILTLRVEVGEENQAEEVVEAGGELIYLPTLLPAKYLFKFIEIMTGQEIGNQALMFL